MRVREPSGNAIKLMPGVQCRFCPLLHDHQSFAAADVRHRHIAEPPHHPAIDRHLEVRLEFESAHELWNGRINYKRIEQVDVVRDEYRRSRPVESGRELHFKSRACEPQNVAEKRPLRPVVLPRVDEDCQNDEERANHREVNPADRPQKRRAHIEIDFLHATMSIAPGRISSDWH